MKKRIPDPVLMLITILVITGFQVYWIHDNYVREKKALEIRANGLFRETVRHVQDSVLKKKLSVVMKDSGTLKNSDLKINFIDRNHKDDTRTLKLVSMLGQKLAADSLKRTGSDKPGTFVSVRRQKGSDSTGNKSNSRVDFPGLRPEDINEIVVVKSKGAIPGSTPDSINIKTGFNHGPSDNADAGKKPSRHTNTVYFNDDQGRQIVIRIDSLFKDSISILQLSGEFARILKSEGLDVPFFISNREDDTTAQDDDDKWMSRLPPGNYAGYNLKLGNSFPYLVTKITSPILFSVFLIGVTLLSFILLYRTLLKQQRLAVMKNEFISNITHELKTPIATVGVAIEALRSFGAAQSAEKTKEYLDISASELQRLGLLVDKVLKLSMFENREVELKKEPFDLADLVNEVLNIMKPQFEKHRAVVTINKDGADFIIEADRLHITSVLYNLLDNALKYSREDPVIEVRLTALPRDIVELKVHDNGIGIPKEYQPRIFEKFFRVPAGNQHTIKGYGLGLSYVSEIVHRHRGFIIVESELGKGTTFTIKIPRRETSVIQVDDKRRIYKK